LKRILVNLTEEELNKLEKLLKKKIYSSRSDAFRQAVELLVEVEKIPELREIVEKLRKRFVAKVRPITKEIENEIIKCLRIHPGSTVNEISAYTKLHRHTVRKYLLKLTKAKVVRQKKAGTSKVSYLSRASRRIKNE